jgi:hypothetical protein
MRAPAQQPVIETVFHKLGGRQALGTEVSSEADLARLANQGIWLRVLDHIARAGFQEIERPHMATSQDEARGAHHRRIRPPGKDFHLSTPLI